MQKHFCKNIHFYVFLCFLFYAKTFFILNAKLQLLKDNDLTLFEEKLKEEGIVHKLIKPYTPRHNGKVERSHRKDNEYFYASHKFYSFDDFKYQLAVHNRKYNNFPMRPLGWKSPRDFLNHFLLTGEVIFS